MDNWDTNELDTGSYNMDFYTEPFISMTTRQKAIVRRLDRTKDRIITWAGTHGWSNIKNYAERTNDNGNIVWFQTDYDFVVEFYKSMFNGDILFGIYEIKALSKIWARYPKRESNRFYNNYRHETRAMNRTANGWTATNFSPIQHDDVLDENNRSINDNIHEQIRQYLESPNG